MLHFLLSVFVEINDIFLESHAELGDPFGMISADESEVPRLVDITGNVGLVFRESENKSEFIAVFR